MRLLVPAMLAAMTMGACSGRGISDKVDVDVDYNEMPTMTTDDVMTMISDSGHTRYRITADLWLVYDQARVPVWRFPDGMLIEKFDSVYGIEATVICDSATYFKTDQLWRLDGHVNIVNSIGEKFLTPQLFWSQRENRIYSDSFIHIERADRTIEGYGFESNDRMTRYSVYNPTGIFPASDFQPGAHPADSTMVDEPADTVAPSRQRRQLNNKTIQARPIDPATLPTSLQ